MSNISRLRNFVKDFTRLMDDPDTDEERVFRDGKALLQELITRDDWLPDAFAEPNPDFYQQFLLHCDPQERFSVVSFVWGPGQTTPVHDHTVWGMVGVMRGEELCEEYVNNGHGLVATGSHCIRPGGIDLVSPTIGDIHKVSNALTEEPSVSIHVYGANIGAISRHTYNDDGSTNAFVSGYTNDVTPNLWDRSGS